MTTFKYKHKESSHKLTIKADNKEIATETIKNMFLESKIGNIEDWKLID